MPTIVQFRRGTTAQNDNFTGAAGELSVDTTLDTLRVHDGATQGGFEIVNTSAIQTLTNKKIGSNLLPDADSAYDLGSASFKWKDLYLSGSTIFLGNAQISASGSSVVLPVGTQIGDTTIAALDSAGIRGLFSAGGDLTYNSSTGEFSFDVENVYTQTNFDSDFNTSLDAAAIGGVGLTYDAATNTLSIDSAELAAYFSTDDITEGTNLYYTDTRFDTRLSTKSTSDLSEGTNLYYTSARADSDAKNAVSVTDAGGDGSLTYSATTGVFTYTGPSAAEVRAHFSGGTGITITDGSIATNDSQIVHDNLSGFVADEHVAHSGVTLTAGLGLNGGGDISASRTFNIDSAELYANFAHDDFHDYVSNEHIDHSTVTLTAGRGLTGGGDITTSRTFAIDSADFLANFESIINHDNLTGFVSNEHIDHSGVTLTAGNGLTGGGDITTSRTFTVGAGTGVTVNSDNVAIGQDVATTADVTFNSVTTTDGLIVGGNLQVNGTTTTVNTQNLSIQDNMIYLNQLESDGTPTISVDVGWAANVNDDGTYMHVGMFRDATDNTFKVFENYLPEPDSALEINTGDASFSLAPFAARTLSGIYLGADSDIDARLSGGTGITYTSGVISTNDAQIVHDNLSGFVADEHVAHSGVSITAGAGLTGGGTIAASRTINVGAGTYIIVNADDIAVDATSANTASKVVARDGSGNFSAGTITATLSGNASTATEATNITATANNSTNETTYITFVDGATGTQGIETDTGLTYNPSTNTLTTTTFSGALSGNATTATTLQTGRTIALSGDVTATGVSFDGSGNITLSTTIAANSVALGTDTTGNYVQQGATSGNGISGSVNSEGGTFTVTSNATSANTGSTIVFRDGSGNFSAGTITANLTGTASLATSITATANNSTNETTYIAFLDGATGTQGIETDTGLTYNPSTNTLTTTTFSGALSGNATTATTWQTGRTLSLTGDVTGTSASFDGSGNISISTTIAANSVALGTDTTGNYVQQGATSGNGISGSVNSEGGTFTVTSNATNANTPSTIVFRDGSGNFSAGTITATLNGNASTATSATSATTATTATNVTVTANNTNNETVYITFVDGATGSQGIETDTGLTYNPSTGVLASVDFNSTSDENLKKNIETIQNASSKVAQLRGVNFDWKDNDRHAMGVIAQEVEKVIPEVVNEVDGIKNVSYGAIVGLLIEAIKDLQQQVDDLKS